MRMSRIIDDDIIIQSQLVSSIYLMHGCNHNAVLFIHKLFVCSNINNLCHHTRMLGQIHLHVLAFVITSVYRNTLWQRKKIIPIVGKY